MVMCAYGEKEKTIIMMKVCTNKSVSMHVSPRATCDHKKDHKWSHCGHDKENTTKTKKNSLIVTFVMLCAY